MTEDMLVGTVREKPIWTFNITGGHKSGTQSVAIARGKSAIIDEPGSR